MLDTPEAAGGDRGLLRALWVSGADLLAGVALGAEAHRGRCKRAGEALENGRHGGHLRKGGGDEAEDEGGDEELHSSKC